VPYYFLKYFAQSRILIEAGIIFKIIMAKSPKTKGKELH